MIHMVDFIKILSKDTGIEPDTIKVLLRSLVSNLEKVAVIGDEVCITGFGKFVSDIKVPRPLKNYLSKGKTVMTKGRVAVKFTQYDSRKKELWKKSSHAKAFEGEK